MSRDTATAKARNRRVRQEALREQLANQKHVEHVVDILKKIADEDTPLEQDMMTRYKVVLDAKFKLIDKYLPTERPTSLEGDLSLGVTSLASIIAGIGHEESTGENSQMAQQPSDVRH